jgi:decaprenylphospho-beta-D-erythro-pentofuranosid-2-ulose 2-reductase
MSKNALILGATSDMALAIARTFADHGYSLTLAARNVDKLKAIEADIVIRHRVDVMSVQFDALDMASHQQFYNSLAVSPDVVICVFGLLGDQAKAQVDWNHCQEIINSNYVGALSILNIVANDFEKRKHGVIVGISSVAGERGRQSNYFYGSAKAGFTAFLSGLRNRLYKSGVHVVTVKPGFVKTKMLENMKTPGPITALPAQVGKDVYRAVVSGKNTIYTLGLWRPIMYVIKTIPEFIFKKLSL